MKRTSYPMLALATLALVAACTSQGGNGTVDLRTEAGFTIANPLKDPTIVTGINSMLVVEGAGVDASSVRINEVTVTEDGLISEELPPLEVGSAVAEVDGTQLDDGGWFLAGIMCDVVDVDGPADCAPGTALMAVLAEGGTEWSRLEDIPAELDRSFLSVKGSTEKQVLVERWDLGSSTYIVADTSSGSSRVVDWSPEPLNLTRSSVRTDENIDDLQPARTSCLHGKDLWVVDGEPIEGGMRSHLSVVNISDDRPTPRVERDLDLPAEMVQDGLICSAADSPYLVAVDHRANNSATYSINTLDGDVGAPDVASPEPGQIAAIDYSRAAVAVQFLGSPTGEIAHTSPDGSQGEVTSTDPVAVNAFVGGAWNTMTGQVLLGEHVRFVRDVPQIAIIVNSVGDELRAEGF